MFVYELSGSGFESSCSHKSYCKKENNFKKMSERDKIILEIVLGVTIFVKYFSASWTDGWTQIRIFREKPYWILF